MGVHRLSNQFKILDATRATWRKIHTEDPRGAWRLRTPAYLSHVCINTYYIHRPLHYIVPLLVHCNLWGHFEGGGNRNTVELVRNLVAHGDAREGKWRGYWRMEWVASTLTPPPNVVYPALLKLMRTPRLPAVDWTDAPTDLNGLVHFGERRNLVSARVPSRSARALPIEAYTKLLCVSDNLTAEALNTAYSCGQHGQATIR